MALSTKREPTSLVGLNAHLGLASARWWSRSRCRGDSSREMPAGCSALSPSSVTPCDVYATGANTSRDTPGLVEFDVSRPIAECGTPTDQNQTLRGPTVSDQLPQTLVHAATGDVDAGLGSPDSGNG